MAYPYFPTYNPYPYPVQPMQTMQQYSAQQSSGIIWVQGIEAMKSFPVSAGQSVLLMDSETNCFGIKTADASGMPLPLRVFDYVERNTAVRAPEATSPAPFDTSGFVTREEFESRIAQLSASDGAKRKAAKKDGESNAE